MARVQLLLYADPATVEVFANVRRKDGGYERIAAVVDTGAASALLPLDLLDQLDHEDSLKTRITIEQAGIARHAFEATEAMIRLFLEDARGARTSELEARAWFAETEAFLIGFEGILDRATLHIDMRETRSGWIEIDD